MALTLGYWRLGYADSTLEDSSSGITPDGGKASRKTSPGPQILTELYQPHLQMKT